MTSPTVTTAAGSPSSAGEVFKMPTEPVEDYNHKVLGLLVERADEEKLKSIFEKYATITVQNEKVVKSVDIIQKYFGIMDEQNVNEKTLKIFANLVDLNKDGYVTFDEFKLFEELLCNPDVLYKCAFQLFDNRGTGYINFENFKDIISHTLLHETIPFDFNSNFITMHFGKDKQRQINYHEFSQIIHDFREEHAIQAFRRFDSKSNGFILPANFCKILMELKSQLLSPYVKDHLESMVHLSNSNTITYPYFMGFISLLNNMELVKQIYLSCSKENGTKEISKGQFLRGAQQFYQITPLEINILYSLITNFRKDGKVTLAEIDQLSPIEETQMPYRIKTYIEENSPIVENRKIGLQMLESAYRFGLGSIAGAIGAFAVYPIDLVKTRMQNQRSKSYVGEIMYRNSIDCFKKTVRHEGFMGLYKGLGVQLVGVAPEKAIKLTVNDLVREKFRQYTGTLPLYGEVIAGACAGGCQVIFTNPMEIVKIRMQVAGEIQHMARSERTLKIVRELGVVGLYKGVRACLLRDIPFSAIYFPSYNHFKKAFSEENGTNSLPSLFCAGFLAGVPAAGLCTPADVIKTRIQVKERLGETQYKGVVDAASKIWKEEGPRAFWKGAGARVFRSSPQFGVTLLAYEFLQGFFAVDFHGPEHIEMIQAENTVPALGSSNPDHIGGYRLANIAFAGLENKFGLCFPKYTKV